MITVALLACAVLQQQSPGQHPKLDFYRELDILHDLLKVRFEKFDDGRFGLNRIPIIYLHRIPGKNPMEGKSAPVASEAERAQMRTLTGAKIDVKIYTVNSAGRVRGPIEANQLGSSPSLFRQAGIVGKAVLERGKPTSSSTTFESAKLRARAVFSTSNECSKCHVGVKKGQPIGAIVYAAIQK